MATKEFIVWNSNLSVGYDEIDNQHKELIKLINELFSAFIEKKHLNFIIEVVSRLTDYTIYHFHAESEIFKKYTVTNLTSHLKEHEEFVIQVAAFSKDLKQNPNALTFKVMNFLQKWTLDHIQGTDKETFRQINK
jgi:hemerythrin-like metal-binding protein